MAQVALDFVPPDEENIVALRIYEGPAKIGPFTQIQRLTPVGAYPTYINSYTCLVATVETDWFGIAWEDSAGDIGAMSSPIQGGTETLVGQLVRRVSQRDRTLDKDIIRQESEATIEFFFGVDPYDVTLASIPVGKQYTMLNGMTYVVMARGIIARLIRQVTTESATLGLVSFKSANASGVMKNVKELMDLAYQQLGIGDAVIIDMTDLCKVYGGHNFQYASQYLFNDQEYLFFPWVPMPIER